MKTRRILLYTWCALCTALTAQAHGTDGLTSDTLATDTLKQAELGGITITARRTGTSRLAGVANGVRLNKEELFRAACCNLGESFTTNPSVDVNYSDAATGAKQIRLLGLSGTYVQMLTENLPNLRGAATPYALDYVPGPWLNSIQVSKGASSVRNGYESITGQIDVEYLKPDDDQGLTVNLYGNTLSRLEANADGNVHLSDKLSTELLLHYQDDYASHDANHDGFMDQPDTRQWNMQNRWKLKTDHYLFHGGLSLLEEERTGGQTTHTTLLPPPSSLHTPPSTLYTIGLKTHRYEGYMKHAFILDADHGTNIALMSTASIHHSHATYGKKEYSIDEKNVYAQLMFETNFSEAHNLSAGLSVNYDDLEQRETTPGAYLQYTYTLTTKLVAMAGLRADHSSRYGTFVTPRFHLKFTPNDVVTLRLSAGKGYRSPHAMAENHFLLASARTLLIDDLKQERAWNYGISSALSIPLFDKTLKLNAEYYHTRFSQQMVVDYDSDPNYIFIGNLTGRSYSNTFQIDASYPVVRGLELTAAYRWNDVKSTYGGKRMSKPLTSRYKGLFSASYKTPLGLWQFDATLQLNGGGRMPTPYTLPDGTPSWAARYRAFEQLQAQVTRWFRHFSIYIGGENLTGRRQHSPVVGAEDPWGQHFDATMVWGPVHGAIGYAGIRFNLGRL